MRVRFGSFVFDSGARALVHMPDAPASRDSGPRAPRSPHSAPRPIHLSPKAFDVLEILLARRPNVVSKDVLMKEIWPGKVVEEANLAIVVGEIRKALGDDSKSPTVIVTVSRRGYRFAAEAQELDPPSRPEAGGLRPAEARSREPEAGSGEPEADQYVRWWLSWHDKTFPLREGENVVGRHPSSGVWIDGTSVSRTHARIIASPGKVTVEDRGSRNGTFIDGRKISGAHVLIDGNTVTFGSESAVFHQWSDEGAAGTEPVRR